MSTNPAIGLEAWEARRKAWTTPNEYYTANAKQFEEKSEKCKDLVNQEGQRKAIYKRLVLHRETFRTALALQHVIPVLVTGWQEDGLWPKGMVVQERSD